MIHFNTKAMEFTNLDSLMECSEDDDKTYGWDCEDDRIDYLATDTDLGFEPQVELADYEFGETSLPMPTCDFPKASPEAAYFAMAGFTTRFTRYAYAHPPFHFNSLEFLRKHSSELVFKGEMVDEIQLPASGMDHVPDIMSNFSVTMDTRLCHQVGEGTHILYGHREANPDFQIFLVRVRQRQKWTSLLLLPSEVLEVTADRPGTFEFYDGRLHLVSYDPPKGTNFTFIQAAVWDGALSRSLISVAYVDCQQYLASLTPFFCGKIVGGNLQDSVGGILATGLPEPDGTYWVGIDAAGDYEGMLYLNPNRLRILMKSVRPYPYTPDMITTNLRKGRLTGPSRADTYARAVVYTRVVDENYGIGAAFVRNPISRKVLAGKSPTYFPYEFAQYIAAVPPVVRMRDFERWLVASRRVQVRSRIQSMQPRTVSDPPRQALCAFDLYCAKRWKFVAKVMRGEIFRTARGHIVQCVGTYNFVADQISRLNGASETVSSWNYTIKASMRSSVILST